MKLIDHAETVVLVIASDLGPDSADYVAAYLLKDAVDHRGAGHPYRRAVVVTDTAWFDTEIFHESPTISVGGAGVNGVAGRFTSELPTVWAEQDRSVIQAEFSERPARVALWGINGAGTNAAVQAFIARGWLDEFLDRCWRFRAGAFA